MTITTIPNFIMSFLIYEIFNTFCRHKIVSVNEYIEIYNVKRYARFFFFFPCFISTLFGFLIVGFKSHLIMGPTMLLCVIIVGELLSELAKIDGRISKVVLIFISIQIYESLTVDTITKEITHFILVFSGSLFIVVFMTIIIFIYESFVRDTNRDPCLLWSNFRG